MNAVRAYGLASALLLGSSPAAAATITLEADRDNTIFSESGVRSNGSGPYLFAGNTGLGLGFTRRALITFDVSAIPAGARIQSATLTLNLSRASLGAGGPVDVSLHRLLADWGEAGSNSGGTEAGGGGAGAPAQSGDATWASNFFGISAWSTNGGDFAALASATRVVGLGPPARPYQWAAPGMAADVQSWIDDGATNFGWLIRGDESGSATARRFIASEFTEDPALRPVLEVSYDVAVVPLPAAAFMFGPAVIGLALFGRRRRSCSGRP